MQAVKPPTLNLSSPLEIMVISNEGADIFPYRLFPSVASVLYHRTQSPGQVHTLLVEGSRVFHQCSHGRAINPNQATWPFGLHMLTTDDTHTLCDAVSDPAIMEHGDIFIPSRVRMRISLILILLFQVFDNQKGVNLFDMSSRTREATLHDDS
jgi:hypothetical protein